MDFKLLLLVKVIIGVTVFSCSSQENNYLQIEPISEMSIDINEPSGLSFGYNNQSYWVVGDGENGRIYHLTLNGDFINKLDYHGQDLEGISYDQAENVLWVVEEQRRELLKMDLFSNILRRQTFDLESTTNHGLEGVCFINNDEIWICHEKSPRKILSLNNELTVSNELKIQGTKDFSGLAYNKADSSLWIISDESKVLIRWDKNTGNTKKYSIPIIKAEGIAINTEDSTIHIVSDKTAKIYIFNIPE